MPESPAAGLGERLRMWRSQYAVDADGETGLSYRKFADRINAEVEDEGEEVAFTTLSHWEKSDDPKPSTTILRALLDAFPDMREEWLLWGEGAPTDMEEETTRVEPRELHAGEGVAAMKEERRIGRDGLQERIESEYPDLWLPLPGPVQESFLDAYVRYVLVCPDGSDLLSSEEGVERAIELAGYLLWLVWAPMRAWNFPSHPTGEIRSYHGMKLMLSAVEHFLPDRRSGDPITAFRDSDEYRAWKGVRAVIQETE